MSESRSRTDPWARFGWLMWAPWMVFLVFPFVEAFEADVATPQRVWAVAVTAAFGAVYAVTMHRLATGRCHRVGGFPEAYVALAVLVLLTLSVSPVLGAGALSFLPFIQSFAMFALPLPWNWWFTGTVLVGALIGLGFLGDVAQWASFGFILVAVTVGTRCRPVPGGAGRALRRGP